MYLYSVYSVCHSAPVTILASRISHVLTQGSASSVLSCTHTYLLTGHCPRQRADWRGRRGRDAVGLSGIGPKTRFERAVAVSADSAPVQCSVPLSSVHSSPQSQCPRSSRVCRRFARPVVVNLYQESSYGWILFFFT